MIAAEAPGWRGATKAYCRYVTEEQRSQPASSPSSRSAALRHALPVQLAGGRSHEELWGPANELPELDAHIVGMLSVVVAFTGERFIGDLNPTTFIPIELDVSATPESSLRVRLAVLGRACFTLGD
jgi:hypothetical protein